MKKFLITTCVILMVSTVANACGGITVKGNSGTSYCLSKHKMNWYSAYAWCNDQKMSLIDLETVCKSSTSCPEVVFSGAEKTHIANSGGVLDWIWTNTPNSSQTAFMVNPYAGYVTNNYRKETCSVLCFQNVK